MTGEPPLARFARLVAGPVLWAAHFLASYVTVAIWCAKVAARGEPLGAARIAVGVYTALALLGIAVVGAWGWRDHRAGRGMPPHDADTPEDRSRFLGFATLLLAGLSAVAVAWEALAAVFVETCR